MSNINTKFLLRIDSWINWNNTTEENKGANLVLLKGEIGLCEFASGQKDANGVPVKPAAVLFKVGDGASKFSELKWASALAADVHDWAKQSENDFVNTFLNLKMNDGTTMRTKLDGVFATDADLASAIAALRLEIPTQLGVMSIKVTDDDVVIGTPAAVTDGNVTIDIKHAKKGPTGGATKGATTDVTVSGYGDTKTIKVPKVTVDEYGHTTGLTEQTLTITLPGQQDLSGYKTEQTAVENKIADGAHVLTSLAQNKNGEISYDVKKLTVEDIGAQPEGNYKTIQTAVDDSAVTGKYVSAVSQNANGEISVSRENLPTLDYAKATQPVTEPTSDSVEVLSSLTAVGHSIMGYTTPMPTKKYVDKQIAEKVAGAVQYLGTTSTTNPLSNLSQTAGKGDFYRVATEIKSGDTVLAHAGDLLIAEKDKPAQQIDGANWSVIHGEEGGITEIVAGNGLTGGGSTGSVTLNIGAGDGITLTTGKVSVKAEAGISFTEDGYLVARTGDGLEFGRDDEIKVKSGNHITVDTNGVHHGAKPSTGTQHAATAGSGRTYVTKVDVDNYGHIAKVYTATESVVDTNTWRKVRVNGTDLLGDAITTKPLNLVAGTNVTLTPDATNGKVTINSSDITVSLNEKTTNNETVNVLSHQITSNGHNLNVNYYEVATKAGLDAVKKSITDLHKISTTGSIYDVEEGSTTNSAGETYLVFYGGTSTDVV